jgi:acyl-CoA synthetase (AMP-forming)/AMP-acid ligase II
MPQPMLQPRPGSLRQALALAGDLHGRMLWAADAEAGLDDCLRGTSLGLEHQDLVGRSVLIATADQFMTALALIELDGVARRMLLCPPDLDPEHMPALIGRAEIDVVVTDRDPATLPGTERLVACPCIWPLERSRRPGPAGRPTEWLLLTSGTTGIPKIVRHSFVGLTGPIKPKQAPDRPPVWATFYDIRRYGGLQIFLRGVLGTGSLVLSSAAESTSDFLHRLGRRGVTHLSGTPSHWRRALMSPAVHAIAPAYVRLSGEIADQGLLDRLRATYPDAAVGHAYASTEAGVGFEVDDGLEGFPADLLDRRGGEVEMKVVGGSLRIRSNRAASGYVGSPGSALADSDGFVDTGDMVEQRGGRCYFVGRRGGIINVGGLKVHPEEVETVINRHSRVRMSLVEGRKNPITGAIVVATVVLNEAPAGDAGEAKQKAVRDEILATCRKALPPYKVPAVLRFASSLDVTAAGKIARHSHA